jgi:hypothetical protein
LFQLAEGIFEIVERADGSVDQQVCAAPLAETGVQSSLIGRIMEPPEKLC